MKTSIAILFTKNNANKLQTTLKYGMISQCSLSKSYQINFPPVHEVSNKHNWLTDLGKITRFSPNSKIQKLYSIVKLFPTSAFPLATDNLLSWQLLTLVFSSSLTCPFSTCKKINLSCVIYRTSFVYRREGGGEGGVYMGRLCPEVQTLTLLLAEKVTQLSFNFHRKW